MLKIVENLWAVGALPPNPAGGAYSAPPDPRAGREGACCPSPRIPPAIGLRKKVRPRFLAFLSWPPVKDP